MKQKSATVIKFGNITLCNGDCMDIIPEIEKETIHCIITDLPYQISRNTNFTSGGDKSKYGSFGMDFGDWDKITFDIYSFLKQSFRLLHKGGTIILFYDIFKMQTIWEIAERIGFKQPRIGFWNKTNPVPVNARINYLSNTREYFICFCKGKKNVFNSYYDKAEYNYPIVAGNERIHPTQKPVPLMEDLIHVHTNEGDCVLDCTMESGSTMVACANTGRRGIGIELMQEYYDIAVKRVKDAQAQLKLDLAI